MDPQAIVRRGYDAIGERYLASFVKEGSSPRARYLAKLKSWLRAESRALELGCGPGYPVTQTLARKCRVVAVDLSGAQLALARRHAVDASLVQADMVEVHFVPECFDAVVAFYSLTHVPRDQHAIVLERIATWLRPGGLFLATMGAGDADDSVQERWLDVPMFFSH